MILAGNLTLPKGTIINNMATASKNKLLWALVILLLVVNTVTLIIFWAGNKQQQQLPVPQGQLGDFIIKKLSLDSTQQQQYGLLRLAHRPAADSLRTQMNRLKDSLFALLRQGNPDDDAKNAATARIAALTQQLELLHLNHFQQLRAICNPAQQQKFDNILHDIVRRLGMPPPRRPDGPPPAGEGPGALPPGERPDGPPPGERSEGPPPPKNK
jgi:periplasmic protein CpxP/Spy